jgi:hypothetical protein
MGVALKGIGMKFYRLFVCLVLLAAAGAAGAAPSAQAILAASDAIRNPDKPFALTVTLVEYRNSKQVDGNTLTVYSKADANSGQFRSLIRFVAPARDANKLMLKNGNELWFFDPSSKASIRLSSACWARPPMATWSRSIWPRITRRKWPPKRRSSTAIARTGAVTSWPWPRCLPT